MPDQKISDLTAETSPSGTDMLPLATAGGATRKITYANLVAGLQPLDSDLTAIAALSTTAFGRSLLALADAAAGRTALGLGTASTANTGDFDAAGAAAAAQAASQPLDSDLTAIAALTTTAFGRGLLALADAAAGRTAFGLGTAATANTGDFDAAGAAAAAQAASQPVDATLTALAAANWAANALPIGTGTDTLSQTSFAANTFPARASTGNLVAKTVTDYGLSLVDDADAATARTTLGLGTLATQSGTFSGTSSGTNTGDQTISDATISTSDITTNNVSTSKHGFAPKAPNDAAKYLDGTGAYSVPGGTGAPSNATYITQVAESGLSAEQALASLATGMLKNTTSTGVLSIGAEGTDYWKPGGTDVALADGGTGASTAAAARTNLGIATVVGGVEWTVVTKTIDEDNASNTTVQADDELKFTATSGGLYEIELYIVYVSAAGGGTPDMKVAIAEDGTTRGYTHWFGPTTGESTQAAVTGNSTSSTASFGTGSANRGLIAKSHHWGNGGACTFYWSQVTSGSNATTVKTGSVLRYRRIL